MQVRIDYRRMEVVSYSKQKHCKTEQRITTARTLVIYTTKAPANNQMYNKDQVQACTRLHTRAIPSLKALGLLIKQAVQRTMFAYTQVSTSNRLYVTTVAEPSLH